MTADNKKGHFTAIILASLVLGIFAGIFFGEYAAPLSIVGDAYVGLLQMTVLPYILFSLIANIGRLTHLQARLLARSGIASLLLLWGVAGFVVVAMAMALPFIPSGSFFSTSFSAPAPQLDLLTLFIPSNLFYSLSNNAVPAVVLFCLLFGVALMGFDNKKTLLEQLDLITAVLQKVNAMVVKLTPVGIFAITASAAGTLTLDEFGRLQAYLLTFTAAVLILAFLLYPLLICSCTNLRWRQVAAASRDAIITAFVLGSIFAVIPLLIRSAEELIQGIEEDEQSDDNLPELLLPLAYPFPDAGKLLTLLFIPFAAWFYGDALSFEDFGLLLSVGPVVMFGKIVTATPFLLNLFEIPTDIFQLLMASGVLLGRLADIAGAMHLITFTVLTTVFARGSFRLNWTRLGRGLLLACVLTTFTVVALNEILYRSYKGVYDKSQVIFEMQRLKSEKPITVMTEAGPNPQPLKPGELHGDRIVQRGLLRVGYNPNNLPFSFLNAKGDLVGFDIDLMLLLAADLGVGLEFIPFEIVDLTKDLDNDHFDIAISGITATTQRSKTTLFSEPYLHVNMAMVVPDYQKREFGSEKSILEAGALKVGVRSGSNFAGRVLRHFPELDIIPLESEQVFFSGDHNMDALLTTAEGGAAWTLIYPGYTTVNPIEGTERAPLVIAIPFEMDMEEYLEMWISLRQLDGTIDELFNYWILGKPAGEATPRWSILRNVLHWVD